SSTPVRRSRVARGWPCCTGGIRNWCSLGSPSRSTESGASPPLRCLQTTSTDRRSCRLDLTGTHARHGAADYDSRRSKTWRIGPYTHGSVAPPRVRRSQLASSSWLHAAEKAMPSLQPRQSYRKRQPAPRSAGGLLTASVATVG